MPTQSLSSSPRTSGLSLGQLLDRTVTDFVDGKGAWERRQRMALNQAAEARAVQEWSRLSLAEKIPIMRREVEIREDVPEYQSRFGVAIDKELETAGERFAPRAGDNPRDYHKLSPDEQALFTIALNADHIPPDHAYVGPVREQTMRLDAERLNADFGKHPAAHQAAFNRLERERPWDHTWYKNKEMAGELPADHPFKKPAQLANNGDLLRQGDQLRAELGDDRLAHRLAFERLAMENPALFDRYKSLANAGELPREHPFEHPASMAAISDVLDGPPMLGPTGFALEEAEVRFDKLLQNSDDSEWLQWSRMDRGERELLAREYAADPTRSDRPLEAPVAHFNLMEAGKAHFETLDQAAREKIKERFFATSSEYQGRYSFRDAVYLDMAKSDLPLEKMPLAAIELGQEARLPRFDEKNMEQERSQARWDGLSATTKAAYVVQYAHDGKLPAHGREREYAAQAARFDWTKESAALAKEWEKLSPEQRKAELDAYKAALATPRHPYEHHIRAEFANELKGLAEHGPQFPGLANVRELKARDAVSQEVGGHAAHSAPAPATPGAVALNPKAAAALDRIGRQRSPGLDATGAGERASRAPKLKSVELGDR